jgi:hypothetical protein
MASPSLELLLEGIEEFLRERVETYDQLAALLWFSEGSSEPRSARDTASALGMPEAAADDALKRLASAGLLRRVSGSARFRYEPARPELDGVVRRLGVLHREHRVEVIRLMNRASVARLRESVLRTFSPHFRRRPDK